MISIINPEIADTERLYRTIFLFWWNSERCAISPSAFLDHEGVSVDRDAGRNKDEIIDKLKLRFHKSKLKAIASLTARKCRKLDTYVCYCKSRNNPYHSEIWNNVTDKMLSLEKAYNLSMSVSFDFIDYNLN